MADRLSIKNKIGVKQLTASKIVTIVRFLEFMGSPMYSIIVFTVDKGEIHKDIPVDRVGPNEKIMGRINPKPIVGYITSFSPD